MVDVTDDNDDDADGDADNNNEDVDSPVMVWLLCNIKNSCCCQRCPENTKYLRDFKVIKFKDFKDF